LASELSFLILRPAHCGLCQFNSELQLTLRPKFEDVWALWSSLHFRIQWTVSWCGANASCQQEESPGTPGLLKRSLNINHFPKPPEKLTCWLSFLLVSVSSKRDKLLGLKLMCLCDYSSLLKLTEAETDESNQFVNFSKGTALKAEID
jgi:hypothetical protein